MRHHQARLRWGALALATLLALAATGCGGDDDGGDEATGDESTETTAAADAGTTAGGGAYGDEGDEDTTTAPDDGGGAGGEAGAVEAAGFEFTPGEVEVAVGDEVTWTNGDDTTHTVTADDASFDLSLDGSGTTASQTFDEAGEFPYHCSIHVSMVGTVVVAEG